MLHTIVSQCCFMVAYVHLLVAYLIILSAQFTKVCQSIFMYVGLIIKGPNYSRL